MLFSDALETAEELDLHFAETRELKGPLHGVPITLKDLSELTGEFRNLGIALIRHRSRRQRLRLVNGVLVVDEQTCPGRRRRTLVRDMVLWLF